MNFVREALQKGELHCNKQLLRSKLAELAIGFEILHCMTYRHAWLRDQGLILDYEASMIKVFSSELRQRLFKCATEMLGLYGQLQQGSKWVPASGMIERGCRSSTHATIYAGTSEIMRNVIALRGLGLPGRP